MIEVVKPTLLLDKEKSLINIKKIKNKINGSNIDIRPHFKTHQSLEVGNWFKNSGINKITVSSVTMAKYFSKSWNDITIAFPVNILEINEIIILQKEIKINLLIDSIEAFKLLEKFDSKFSVYVKINVGYNRAGLDYDDSEVDDIINLGLKSSNINVLGFISHFGNTYSSSSKEEIQSIFDSSLNKLKYLAEKFPRCDISIGDTPSSSIVSDYPDFISEIRPGNFIFYDLAQLKIGSCSIRDIAVRMVCPIVSKNEKNNTYLIYGGAVHFSKDFIVENGNKCFGYVYSGNTWSTENKIGNILSLSQEHGKIQIEIDVKLKIGDLVSVIPVHSCLTVDKMKEMYVGNNKISTMS